MNIVLLGAPGSGKGTQGEYIVEKYGFIKLSTGDMLRQEISNKSEMGVELKQMVQSGLLVPDLAVMTLIENNMKLHSNSKGVIFDGFPRTVAQAILLEEYLSSLGKKIDAVIEFVVDEESLVKRLSNRFNCAGCGASYNKIYKPTKIDGVCDVCGGKEFVVRADDNADVIRKRFEEYMQQTALLLPFYDQKKILHKVVADLAIDQVAKNVNFIIDNVIGS